MISIKFFPDSGMFHLTPSNQKGFGVPDELWKKYLLCREMLSVKAPYYRKVLSDILQCMDKRKQRTRIIDRLATIDKNREVC